MANITARISDALSPRVEEYAAALGINPNLFVNRCVEGCLLGMESAQPEIPQIVQLYRNYHGLNRNVMERALVRFVHLVEPNYEQIPVERKKILIELVANYEGVLDEKARIELQRKAKELYKQKSKVKP